MNTPIVQDDIRWRALDYDCFVSFADEDQEWVYETFIPDLKAIGIKVCIEDDIVPGVPKVRGVEGLISNSRYTIAVLSEAYLANKWLSWISELANYLSIVTGKDHFIPLTKAPCTFPLELINIVCASSVDETTYKFSLQKIVTILRNKSPFPRFSPGLNSELENPFHMTLSPFRSFVDRSEEIQKLHDTLMTATDGRSFVGLFGFSGNGKTQLAIQYAYRYRSYYQGVYHINGSQGLVEGLASLYKDLPNSILDLGKQERARNMSQLFQSKKGALIVIDDLNQLEELQTPRDGDYIRPMQWNSCHVLFTSTENVDSVDLDDLGIRPISLDVLPGTEAIEFLLSGLRKRGRTRAIGSEREVPVGNNSLSETDLRNRKFAQKICDELDNWPIAIELARATLSATASTTAIEHYYRQIEQAAYPIAETDKYGEQAMGDRSSSTGHTFRLRAILENVINSLNENERRFLFTLGLFPNHREISGFLAYMLAGLDFVSDNIAATLTKQKLQKRFLLRGASHKAINQDEGKDGDEVEDKETDWQLHKLIHGHLQNYGSNTIDVMLDALAGFSQTCDQPHLWEKIFVACVDERREPLELLRSYRDFISSLLQQVYERVQDQSELSPEIISRIDNFLILFGTNTIYINGISQESIIAQQLLCSAEQNELGEWVHRLKQWLDVTGIAYFSFLTELTPPYDRTFVKPIGLPAVILEDDGVLIAVGVDGNVLSAAEDATSDVDVSKFLREHAGRLVNISNNPEDFSKHAVCLKKTPQEVLPANVFDLLNVDSDWLALAVSNNHRWFAVSTPADYAIKIINANEGTIIGSLHEYSAPPDLMVLKPDDGTVFFVIGSLNLSIWRPHLEPQPTMLSLPSELSHLLISSNGQHLLGFDVEGKLWIWNTVDMGRSSGFQMVYGAGVTAVALSGDDRFLVTAHRDKTLRVWDWRAQLPEIRSARSNNRDESEEEGIPTREIARLTLSSEIQSIDISYEGRQIAAIDDIERIFHWNLNLPET